MQCSLWFCFIPNSFLLFITSIFLLLFLMPTLMLTVSFFITSFSSKGASVNCEWDNIDVFNVLKNQFLRLFTRNNLSQNKIFFKNTNQNFYLNLILVVTLIERITLYFLLNKLLCSWLFFSHHPNFVLLIIAYLILIWSILREFILIALQLFLHSIYTTNVTIETGFSEVSSLIFFRLSRAFSSRLSTQPHFLHSQHFDSNRKIHAWVNSKILNIIPST